MLAVHDGIIVWQVLADMLAFIRPLGLLYQWKGQEAPCLAQGRNRIDAGAAEEDDSQEAIPSSSREQIESFIGAVAEKIAPPAAEARPNSVGHFPPRQVSQLAVKSPSLSDFQGPAALLCSSPPQAVPLPKPTRLAIQSLAAFTAPVNEVWWALHLMLAVRTLG